MIYRGTVTDVVGSRVVVRIPAALGRRRTVGPLEWLETGRPGVEPDGTPVIVPGLVVGDRVLVTDTVDGRTGEYVVLGKLH